MKKYILLLASLMFLATFTSCFKDKDGEYKPKEKISRIYKDYGQGDGKELEEIWTWDEKQLQKIDHYWRNHIDWSEEFIYNKKGQIERVDCYEDSEYIEYTYDGDKLSKSTYYYKGSIIEEYVFKHDGKQIAEVEVTYYGRSRRNSRLMNEGYNPLRILLHENNYQTFKKAIENLPTSRDLITIKLEWEKENVSKIEFTSGSERYIFELKYDDMLNPLKNFFSLYPEVAFCSGFDEEYDVYSCSFSKNNIIELRYIEDDETEIYKYSYSYEDKFPIVKRYNYYDEEYDWYEDEYYPVTRTTTIYYEYE